MSESELSDYDKLGYLDIDALDNVVSLADNMAIKLAVNTTLKLRDLQNKASSQLKQ